MKANHTISGKLAGQYRLVLAVGVDGQNGQKRLRSLVGIDGENAATLYFEVERDGWTVRYDTLEQAVAAYDTDGVSK